MQNRVGMAVAKYLCLTGQKWQPEASSPLHRQMETTPMSFLPFRGSYTELAA